MPTRRALLGAFGAGFASQGIAAESPERQSAYFPDRRALDAAGLPDQITSARTGGYHREGDGGGAFHIRDSGVWLPVPENGTLSVLQFGAVGDGVADDHPAFEAALSGRWSDRDGDENVRILVPPPRKFYRISRTLHLRSKVWLVGFGYADSYFRQKERAHMVFDDDQTGIVVHNAETWVQSHPSETGPHQSRFSRLEGLSLAGGGIDAEAHGLQLRAPAVVRDCVIGFFPGDGIHSWCSVKAGADSPQLGNASRSVFVNVRVFENGRAGLFLKGRDVNACNLFAVDAANNGAFGIYDESMLGNHYTGCHTAGNGQASTRHNRARKVSSTCSHEGHRYGARFDAPEGSLNTVAPGTDERVWARLRKGGPNARFPAWNDDSGPIRFRPGASYAVAGRNNESVLIGAYAEMGQPPAFLGPRTTSLGGTKAGSIVRAAGAEATTGQNSLTDIVVSTSARSRHAPSSVMRRLYRVFLELMPGGRARDALVLGWDGHEARHVLSLASGEVALSIPSRSARGQAGEPGRRQSAGLPSFPQGLAFGDGANGGSLLTASEAPPERGRRYERGDVIWNSRPASGLPVGWVCVESGDPGVWKPFAVVGS